MLVEAPAGTGKTFEAVGLALDTAADLPEGREILLLTHTNAAAAEFGRRVKAGTRPRVRTMTLDAFATEVLTPYAAALGLAAPLRPGPLGSKVPGTTDFARLAPTVVELFDRSPVVARCLARHYPLVIFDEHQDARTTQHEIARRLRAAGARIRLFGDPVQAIYDNEADPTVRWELIEREADISLELEEPHRWKDHPKLGEWLLLVRKRLVAGERLPHPLPSGVSIDLIPGMKDAHMNRRVPIPELSAPLWGALSGKTGTIAVLTYHRHHRRGLRSQLAGRMEIHEGADQTELQDLVYAAEQATGDPIALVRMALDVLELTCSGLSEDLRERIQRACGADGIAPRSGKDIAPVLERLRPLYRTPDLTTWCAVVGGFGAPPGGLRVIMSHSLRNIWRLRRGASYSAFLVQGRRVRETGLLPQEGVYTIHAAKGREFENVIIAPCGPSQFPDGKPLAARCLYVALSRARRTIHVLAGREAASPLLR